MAASFKARLDEMLRSRQMQLQRLNEEMETQSGKRSILRERKAGLRRIRQRLLLLERNVWRIKLHISMGEEELRRQKERSQDLGKQQRSIICETSELEQAQPMLSGDERGCLLQLEQAACDARRSNAWELQEMLKRVEKDELTARRSREGLQRQAELGLAEVQRSRNAKCQVEREVADAGKRKQLQEEMKSLQLENQQVEGQLLHLMHLGAA